MVDKNGASCNMVFGRITKIYPTHHTTQRGILHRVVLGKGGPSQAGPWPKKQDASNKLSRRAAPLAKVFWGQGWFPKVWAQKNQKTEKKQNPKIKKMEKSLSFPLERKSNQNISQTRFFQNFKKSEMFCFFLIIFFFDFSI